MVSETTEVAAEDDALALQKAMRIAANVPDPELPYLTIEDLGILRAVKMEAQVVVAEVTPTYSGCPAVTVIEDAVYQALTNVGFNARVDRVISPPWTTDFITEEGRRKLLANGISPPEKAQINTGTSAFFTRRLVKCPFCKSEGTEKVSEFGSTPCKAQYRCTDCLEPFDHFKCH